MSSAATPPVSFTRLKQIASDACNTAIGDAEFYEHSKTESWNSHIINTILKAVISESTLQGANRPCYKFACNSTIVQHVVPTFALNKSRGGTDTKTDEPHVSTSSEGSAAATSTSTASGTDGKPHVGRRGMNSATGAYWDESKDGMWSFKYNGGESKGMDVVIMLIWIAF